MQTPLLYVFWWFSHILQKTMNIIPDTNWPWKVQKGVGEATVSITSIELQYNLVFPAQPIACMIAVCITEGILKFPWHKLFINKKCFNSYQWSWLQSQSTLRTHLGLLACAYTQTKKWGTFALYIQFHSEVVNTNQLTRPSFSKQTAVAICQW